MACHYRLIMSGRQSVVEEALAINLETMQPQPAEAAAHQSAQAAVLVPLLRLTEQQQEIVSLGMGLYYDLLAVIHHERQDINSQMSAVDEAAADSGEAGSPSSRASSNRDSHLQDLPDRRELLQKQEALTNRLDLLLHKEVRAAYDIKPHRQQSIPSVGPPCEALLWPGQWLCWAAMYSRSVLNCLLPVNHCLFQTYVGI
jgi:hypothetical protein